MLYYLLATACQDGRAWNERKKLQHVYQLVLNMFWDLCKSYARTFRCLELLRWERTSSKVQCELLLAGSFIVLCWTLNLHWFVLLGSSKKITSHDHWITAFSQINGCHSSRCPSCLTKAQRLCANGPFEDCQVRMFVKQRALPSANVYEAAEQAVSAVTCCWK